MDKKESAVEISKINNISEYFDYLLDNKERLLIIFSVKDTPGFHFKQNTVQQMKDLGIKTSLQNKHLHSFIGIINKGEVLVDKISPKDESLIVENLSVSGIQVDVFSSVFIKENISVITIDQIDYSPNRRGLNIVVYDYDQDCVIDSVSFDTHSPSNNCAHGKNTSSIILGKKSAISHSLLFNEMVKIRKENDDLKKMIQTSERKLELLLWSLFRTDGETERQAKTRFFRFLPGATEPLRTVQMAGELLLKGFDKICSQNNIDYWISSGTLLGAVRHEGFIPWDDDVDVCMRRDDYLKLKNVLENNEDFMIEEMFKSIGPKDMYVAKRYVFKFKLHNDKIEYYMDIFIVDDADQIAADNIKKINLLRDDLVKKYFSSSLERIPKAGKSRIVVIKKSDKDYTSWDQLYMEFYDKYKKMLGDGKKDKYIVWSIDNSDFWFGKKRVFPYKMVYPLKRIEFAGGSYLAPNDPDGYLEILYNDYLSIPNDMFERNHFSLSESKLSFYNDIVNKYL